MSQTAIPLEFERYLQNQISVGDAPDMNEMIFAHIPGLDSSQPINRENGLPDVSLWVHQQDIDQVGKLGDNALAYSVVIPGTDAEFTFNAIYLRDKNVPNSCGMVVHKAEETKENGMASTKSLVQAYDGAAQIAGITVDASTWQIDYQARLKGIEEDHRLACLDNYGHTAFVDRFDVTQQADPNKYKVTPGVVYVGGLRGVLAQEVIQTVATKPNGLYVDVVREGTALSVWENKVTIAVSETELTDYVDGNGEQHYVAKLAAINADGSVVDWRVKGGLAEHMAASDPHTQYLKESDYQKEKESRTAELFKLPIYPECLTPDNRLSLDLTGTTLTVQKGQALRLRGWFDVSTTDIDLANRQFQIDAAKMYHLRYDRVNGFRLLELSNVAYNPDAINQKDARFDSTFDDVLLALVDQGQVTSYKNVADIVESQLGYVEITHSFPPSINQVLFSVSVLNDYARSIDTRLVSEILFCQASGANFGFVIWKANGATIHSSKRFHAGTSSGYLYQEMVQADESYRLLRETIEFTATLGEKHGSPYLNPQYHPSWVNLPSSSYLRVEVA